MPNQPKRAMRGIRLDDDTWRWLDEYAKKTGPDVKRSDVIRDAIAEYRSRHGKPRVTSKPPRSTRR